MKKSIIALSLMVSLAGCGSENMEEITEKAVKDFLNEDDIEIIEYERYVQKEVGAGTRYYVEGVWETGGNEYDFRVIMQHNDMLDGKWVFGGCSKCEPFIIH